jgi:hypothetical protein
LEDRELMAQHQDLQVLGASPRVSSARNSTDRQSAR